MNWTSEENSDIDTNSGPEMYSWACTLFPIMRSLTGSGVRETLDFLNQHVGGMAQHAVPSGAVVFDWVVPEEWSISDAYIANLKGDKIIKFSDNNLHVVGYSHAIDEVIAREDLDEHLHSIPEMPDAIPYVTSYYERRWGFCLTHRQRESLTDEFYKVRIDSRHFPGELNFGEIYLPGSSGREIMFSTYICHPSMANNELSGPVVTAALARFVQSLDRYYSYRFVFVPETIGSIAYLSRMAPHLRQFLDGGFTVTCVGDDRCHSLLRSKNRDSLVDRVAQHALSTGKVDYIEYSFLSRGSDERQYSSPLIDLPFVSLMRSKYGEYKEYHTSLDNLDLISPSGLWGGYKMLQRCIKILECNFTYAATIPCEPQLGRRGLYPTLSVRGRSDELRRLMNILAYVDGEKDLLAVADEIGEDIIACSQSVKILLDQGLLRRVDRCALTRTNDTQAG